MASSALGLDIGGANVKLAHSNGTAILRPFELWKNPSGLTGLLRDLLSCTPTFDCVAVTMTAELCDCFATKREGVTSILDTVVMAAGERPVYVWQNNGCFVDVATAKRTPLQTAAANWLALAEYGARYLDGGAGLIIDIGSTTTDIVPVHRGSPIPLGRSDIERLRCQELVYTGIRRTPVCALLGVEGAAEWFATTLDVYLLLGNLPEDPADNQTADGGPATRKGAHARLARMLCSDSEALSEREAMMLARKVSTMQTELLRRAVLNVATRLPSRPSGVMLAGSGEFLAREVLRSIDSLAEVPVISLSERLGVEASKAACAYALAVLATERIAGRASGPGERYVVTDCH
jgi:(4-(4-[2-(gamma-L-glutamylamino)ethyl]phenoxymethyl)furan-2-yl)methanamine synthase